MPGPTSRGDAIWRWLQEPRDGSSLAFFRVAFGLLMLWGLWPYFAHGWIKEDYVDTLFHFSYYGFDWVRPWPEPWIYVHFLVIAGAALYIAAGLFYRAAAAVFFLGFSYNYLLDQTHYLNHYYLIILLSLLLVFVPAHRRFSLDAVIKPGLASPTVPAWSIYLLRAQLALVYFFAGIAKINPDWLRGEPMRMWLRADYDLPIIGPLLRHEVAPYVASYGGLLIDLLAAPLLLWRRTRPWMFGVLAAFHLLNTQLWEIGVFPWLMLAATTLFFEPDWPRRAIATLRRALPQGVVSGVDATAAAVARGSSRIVAALRRPESSVSGVEPSSRPNRLQLTGFALAAIYLLIQVFLPVRHWLYPGNVHWTEEGHRYAWHMKLRSKRAKSIAVRITDPVTRRGWVVDPRRYLTPEQFREMPREPEMLLLFSHWLADGYEQRTGRRPEVRIRVTVSLNGRRAQLLLDPRTDLARERRSLAHADWILPLHPPRYR